MRQVLSFVIAGALLIAGLYLLYIELFMARVIVSKLILAGAFVAVLGAAWLWADFIAPIFRGTENK